MKKQSMLLRAVALMLSVLMLVSACAFAADTEDIALSKDVQFIYDAWEAVRETYGLSKFDLGLFVPEPLEDGEGIVFSYLVSDYDALGAYTVLKEADGKLVASWSHDGMMDAKALETADLSSPVWGPVQAKKIVEVETAQQHAYEIAREKSETGDVSMEDRAAIDRIYTDAGFKPLSFFPDPKDMPVAPDKAREIAIQALSDVYGIDADAFSPVSEQVGLVENPHGYQNENSNEDTRRYVFAFVMDAESMWADVYGWAYAIEVDADTGKPTMPYISGAEVTPVLPEGPLQEKERAVQDFLVYDGMESLPHEARPDAANRIKASGHLGTFSLPDYQVPESDAFPAEDTLVAGTNAIQEAYSLPAEALALFDAKNEYIRKDGKTVWAIELAAGKAVDTALYEARDALGYYTAILDGKTGDVVDVTWNHDFTWGDGSKNANKGDINEANWIVAPIWDASILPHVVSFMNDMEALGPISAWEDEEYRAQAKLRSDAGDIYSTYGVMEPGEGDMQRAQAEEIAVRAFGLFYDMPAEHAQNDMMNAWLAENEYGIAWNVRLDYTHEGAMQHYFAMVDAKSGEIQYIDLIIKGNG